MSTGQHPNMHPEQADAANRLWSERSGEFPQVRNRVAWAATVALLVLHAVRLARFSVDWPLHDDFTQILAVPGYLANMPTAAERLTFLFSLSVEHRIATLRFFGLGGALAPGGLNFAVLIAIGNAMLVVAGALLVSLFPHRQRASAALVAALLLTSVTHYGAQYWATGALQHFGVCAYAMGALIAADRGRTALSAGLALLAAFTAANGLMVMPAIVLLLALSGRRRAAVGWTIAGVALFSAYFVGYETPPARVSLVDLLYDPIRLATFGLAALGAMGDSYLLSVAMGLAIVAAWLGFLFLGDRRRIPPTITTGMLFFVATCGAIAFGRAALGAEAVTISRYRVYSAAAILLTLAVAVPLAGPRSRTITMGAAVLIAAVVHVLGSLRMMPYMIELSELQRASRDHYAALGHGFYLDFPPPEFGDFLLRRAADDGTYDPTRNAALPTVPTGGMPSTGSAPSVLSSHVQPDVRIVSVAGMMGGRQRAATLWLDDGRAAFRAELSAVRCLGARWDERTTVFRGTVDVSELPIGRYRVGYDAGAGSGVAWTEQHVQLR